MIHIPSGDGPFYRRVKEKCGRPTLAGEPCKQWRMPVEFFDPEQWQPASCILHLTDEEKRLREVAAERAAEFIASIPQRQEPECWSWPVPERRAYETEEDAAHALYEFQLHHGCAICGATERIVEDHDHTTGLVRGNLCFSCNVNEGMGRDAPDFAKYRVRPPATIIGVRVRYWSPFHGYAEPDPPRDLAMLAAAIDTLSLPRPEDLQKETTDG